MIMKLSISNIGWSAENDAAVYGLMKKYEYSGLEIAPTRIFSHNPYEKLKEAEAWGKNLKKEYGFSISSMQSIWYGRQEKLFGSEEERKVLLDYTKEAVDFASVIGCKNLVFGCPKNRHLPDGTDPQIAVAFFRQLGDYAASKGTAIGIEANPPIYNTNYINDTITALQLIRQVDSKGFLLNLDVGTIIENKESVYELEGNVERINHVHISEPGLKPIERRALHGELFSLLRQEGYTGFISIEMGKVEELSVMEEKLEYIRSVFINE